MLTKEAMLATCKEAREFSSTFNNSLLGTKGVFHVAQEARERGKLSAREKFYAGIYSNLERYPLDMPVEKLYPNLIVSISNMQDILNTLYPAEFALKDLLTTDDPLVVKYVMEQCWCKGEGRGFYELKKEVFLFVQESTPVKQAGSQVRNVYCSLREYLYNCFEERQRQELVVLMDNKDNSRLEVQKELTKRAAFKY